MSDISISFEYPWFLLLLLVIPLLWVTTYGSMVGLGNGRRIAALTMRSLLLLLIVLALAGVQWVWISNKTTAIFLLDQSDSIPRAKREVMLKYAIKSVGEHRRQRGGSRDDMSGLIVFGREAAIEFPPFDDDLPNIDGLESYLGRTDATNLESALKLAQASFPENSAKRIVLITDGNETLGASTSVAKSMSEQGIGFDVVPINLSSSSEILVEKIDLPSNIRQGQPFETKVVINRYQEGIDKPVTGKLRLTRTIGKTEEEIFFDEVTLDSDVNVFPFRGTIDQPAGYTYRADFVPDDNADDSLEQNNRSDAFTYVRGKGRVLLIEDWYAPGEYDLMIEALRRSEIEVDIMPSDELFTSLTELQVYDCVILAGVPKSSGDEADAIANFSDDQIKMLVTNTEQFGAGLIMLGGPSSFGAGGWSNTEIEKAMPVDFQIKNKKIEAVGALAMILHASEIAQGNYWQKRIGQAALQVLGPMDYCGVINYGNGLGDSWLWNTGGGPNNPAGMMRVGPSRAAMINRIRAMVPGDMPDFQPSMQMALASLSKTNASIKHMIIISDGDPTAPSNGIIRQFASNQIKISTVAVGAHGPAGHNTLQNIATVTGGNYYVASNPTALPKIFQREAMRVSRPLVYEPEGGLLPRVTYPHEIVQGLPRDLPNLRGFVLTTVKDSPLVTVPIRASKPQEPENQALLAVWEYGAGRTAVWTSDVSKRWATGWTGWPAYDQYFSQLVRWTMRPTETDAKFTVATNVADGKVQVVVNALNQDDEFLNFLDMQAVAVDPNLEPLPLVMRQVAPGRYVGEFETGGSGSYLVNVIPGPQMAPITTGASVPFSAEYRLRKTNFNMLEQIAQLEPEGGQRGVLAEPLDQDSFQELVKNDTYRGGLPRSRSLQDIWHFCLLLGGFCLFADIFFRRVALDYAYPLKQAVALLRPKTTAQDVAREESLTRLRSKKSQVSGEMEQAKASTRFEVDEAAATEEGALSDAMGGGTEARESQTSRPANSPSMQQQQEEEGYTSRLLAAKKAAQKKTDGDKDSK